MRTSHVRAFALIGALCCALTRLGAQTNTQVVVPLPSPVTTQPGSTAQTPPPTSQAHDAPSTTTVVTNSPTQTQRPSPMIRRGDAQLEWRTSYSHSSKNAIFVDGVAILPVIVVGQIGVERVRRDTVTTSISARYGLLNNLQTEVRVPLRFEYDRYAVPEVNPPQERAVSGFGLGDVEGSMSYQFPRQREDSIRWIITGSAKSDTGRDSFEIDPQDEIALGTGFWNAKIGLSGVKVVDPAAVFWNVGYTYTWERDNIPVIVTDQENGEQSVTYVSIKPGNTYDMGGGLAYAINSRLSINTGLSISFNESARSNGKYVANTSVTSASLRLGTVWLTDRSQPVDISVSIGLTEDSPDFSIDYKRSFRF